MRNRTHAEFGIALALELLGAAGGTLFALQTWQTVTVHAPRPRPDVVVHVTGRVVDAAPLAFGLVALAGVVAVLATRGVVRRAVGVIVTLAGAGLVWRAVTSAGAVSASRARTLVIQQHAEATVAGTTPGIAVHPVWAVLTIVSGVLVVAGGLLVAWHGNRWRAMSSRYENTAGRDADPTRSADPDRAAATIWTALDRGEDPTKGG